MTARPVAVAVALIRSWTRCYTWRAPDETAAARRREIECDLWESLHDHVGLPPSSLAAALVRRLVAGLADDVIWRIEQLEGESALRVRRLLAVTGAILLVTGTVALPAHRTRGGRVDLEACAEAAIAADSTAEYRLQVMTCAGAFFKTRN